VPRWIFSTSDIGTELHHDIVPFEDDVDKIAPRAWAHFLIGNGTDYGFKVSIVFQMMDGFDQFFESRNYLMF
jgi:hypothetical protein